MGQNHNSHHSENPTNQLTSSEQALGHSGKEKLCLNRKKAQGVVDICCEDRKKDNLFLMIKCRVMNKTE